MLNIKNKEFVTVVFIIYSVSVLYYSSFCVHPAIIGDGNQYVGMTVAFYNHLSPDLRDSDLELLNSILNKNGIFFTRDTAFFDFWESLSGKYYSLHFWAYSLLCLPLFSLLHLLGLNEMRAFPLTNSLLLIISSLGILLFSRQQNAEKNWMFLFLSFSPALFYIAWPHAEVYSYSLVVLALVFVLRKDYMVSVLLSSLASLQNPPIAALTLYLIFAGWRENEWNIKELIKLGSISLVSVIPYAFYYWNYHRISLIADVVGTSKIGQYTGGSADLGYVSAGKILSFFIDPNLGIFAYMPVIFILAIVSLLPSIRRRDTFVLELWITVILMAFVGSTAAQLNSGMMYIHRFSVWMSPILVLIVIYSMKYYPRVKVNSILLIGLIISIGIASPLLINYDPSGYLRFNSLARAIIIDTPWAYNPSSEMFIERTVGVDGANPDEYLPIIITYDNRPRKIFTDNKHDGEVDQWIQTEGSGSYTINRLDDRFYYINFDNSFEDLIPNPANISAIYPNHKNDIIKTDIPMIGFRGNWYYLEMWDSGLTRWISDDVSLLVVCQEKKNASLLLQATSYMIPRVLNVELNGEVIKESIIGVGGFSSLNMSLILEKGINIIRFKVPQGCEICGDGRCLSIALQNLSINEIKQNDPQEIAPQFTSSMTFGSGFYDQENWSGTSTRWMQANATLRLSSPANRTTTLSLQAQSFYRNRTLEIYAGGVPVAQVAVPISFANLSVPIHIAKGDNSVQLHVREGCERPSDITELNNPDERCLSVAVQNLIVT